jgi:signal peptidase I
MLIVLLILAVAQFVACPLLLWVAAKVIRIPGVGIVRAYVAFGFLFALALEGLASFIFVDLSWPILVVNSCWLIAGGVLLVKAIFRTKWLRALGCMALTIAANVALSFAIKAVAVEAFVIAGGSMAPILLPGDRFLADKVTVRFRQPRRGEVVVFRPPHNPDTNFIMRAIGIEGDKLELSGDDLLVNGVPAGKCPMMRGVPPPGNMKPMAFPAVVPPGKLFVLGDDPNISLNSRHWGFADANQVIGLAVVIYASVDSPPMQDRFMGNPQGLPDRQKTIRWQRIGKAID